MKISISKSLTSNKGVGGISYAAGAIGRWRATDATTAPNGVKYVPNAINPGPAPTNILTGGRRMFAKSEWITSTGATLVDDAATGPDGVADVSTAAFTGNWTLGPPSGVGSLPAGNWVVGLDAERNAGSDQVFCFTKDNTSTRSAQKTATSGGLQSFSYAFTLASTTALNLIRVCSIDGSTAANLKIRDLRIAPGTVDPGPQSPCGHLILNQTAYQTTASYGSGWLDFSSGGYGLIQFPDTFTLTEFTAHCVVQRTAAGSAYRSFLSKVQAFTQFSLYTELSAAGITQLSGAGPVTYNQLTGSPFNLLEQGSPQVISHRYNATTGKVSFWVGRVKLLEASVTMTPVQARDFFVSLTNSLSLGSGSKFNAIHLYDRALTDAEMRSNVTQAIREALISLITVSDSTPIIGSPGDSLSGAQVDCPAYLTPPDLTPKTLGAVLAVSGATLGTVASLQMTRLLDMIPPNKGAQKFIVPILVGANGLASYSGGTTAFITDLKALHRQALDAGALTIAISIPPISGNSAHNTARDTVNADMATWVAGGFCSDFADYAGDAQMGPDNSYTLYPTLWRDITHPSALGNARYRPILAAAVNRQLAA